MTIAIPRLTRLPIDQRGITLADFLVPIRARRAARRPGPAHRADRRRARCSSTSRPGSSIPVPGSPVPVTGQTFGVLARRRSARLPARRLAASLLYVLIGLDRAAVLRRGQGRTQRDPRRDRAATSSGSSSPAAIVGRLAELGWDRHDPRGARRDADRQHRHLRRRRALAHGVLHRRPADRRSPRASRRSSSGDAVKLLLAAAAFPVAWWLVGRGPDDR